MTSLRSKPRPGLLPLWILLFAAASCSVERHYKTLSIFFDGVPDPNAPKKEAAQPQIDYSKMTSTERAALLGVQVVAPTVHFHPPVKERLCAKCHLGLATEGGSASLFAGLPTLVAPIEKLCANCHERPEGKYVHGPAGTMRCDICHHPHQSSFEHLVLTERHADLCQPCHTEDTFMTQERHKDYGDADCTTCHNPHSSELQYLLKPDWEETLAEVSQFEERKE